MIGLFLDFALDLLLCFADAIAAVWRWAGINGEFAARVEPPRDKSESR